jgi:uncharacterized protein (DUF362 family)
MKSRLDDAVVAVYHTPVISAYPGHTPFHPPEAYPEYPFQTPLDETNNVYRYVRQTFLLLGLDAAHAGTPLWNPLGELIHPGDQVLLKPNLVKDRHNKGLDPLSMITHGSVVRAVLDYAYLALKGQGKILLGDSPLQRTNMSEVLRINGLDGVIDFYSHTSKVNFEFLDFRLEQALYSTGMIIEKKQLGGADGGYLPVDLEKTSYLDDISHRYKNFRVTDYDRLGMVQHHNLDSHQYLIPHAVLDSNVVLNIPKLKTHRKVGISVSLKNLVGINGHKDWLPHHSNLSSQEGGDEYLHPSRRKRLDTAFDERIDIIPQRWKKYVYRFGRLALRLSGWVVPFPDPYFEGSWWGNDTLWRTALDLNRILLYADKGGSLQPQPQRAYLSLVDGLLAGEGEGPIEPTPRWCGLVIAGFNPALLDSLCARIMGFEPARIPLVHHALEQAWLLPPGTADRARVVSNDPVFQEILNWHRKDSLAFSPPRGWTGHIELED